MGFALTLEDFEDAVPDFAPGPGETDDGPSEDWRDGHAAGRAEAKADMAAEQATLNATLVQRLEDMAFGYAEARAMLLRDLKPLFETLSTKLLPDLGDDLLAAHLARSLIDAAAADLSHSLVLRVSTADVVAVSDLLGQATNVPFTCRSDPTLPVGTALVTAATSAGVSRESSLDVATLTQSLRAILAAFATEQPQEAAHG